MQLVQRGGVGGVLDRTNSSQMISLTFSANSSKTMLLYTPEMVLHPHREDRLYALISYRIHIK